MLADGGEEVYTNHVVKLAQGLIALDIPHLPVYAGTFKPHDDRNTYQVVRKSANLRIGQRGI